MLTILSSGRPGTRRDFLTVGSLAATGLTLPHLLWSRANAAEGGRGTRNTSVVWLWLGGGATHVETFDPKMSAPAEYRSVTGEVATTLPGVTIGGTFPKMATLADRFAFVRSFAHGNNGHGGGTHWVMTGMNNRQADNGGSQSRPSAGSIVARLRGSNHARTGVPAYVSLGRIASDGPAYLGSAFSPFDPRGDALRNMQLSMSEDRLSQRRGLLGGLDQLDRKIDQSGLMEGLTEFEQQAYGVLLQDARKAFDVKLEDPRVVEKYGPGLGQQMLQARRLCEHGAGFVTIHYGGWDMHSAVKSGVERRSPQLDQAVSAFLEDTKQRGLADDILLVITGEFGRTPKINASAGRDHWCRLSTLALAGGGLKTGKVVGESTRTLDRPKTTPVTPQDLMATVFHALDIPQDIHFYDTFGRPNAAITSGKPIAELV